MTTHRVYDSLDAALDAFDIPLENRPSIRHAMEVVGVARYEGTASYIKAIRSSEGPTLRIQNGFTNGFASKEEALQAAGDNQVWASTDRRVWGFSHPLNRVRLTESGPISHTQGMERRAGESTIIAMSRRLLDCLRHGGSVITDVDVWTDDNVDSLFTYFVEAPDTSGASFMEKLRTQLTPAPAGAIVLFAELLLLDLLPLANLTPGKKRELLEAVLGFSDNPPALPADVLEALEHGVFHGGQGFNQRRWYHLVLLLELVRWFRSLPEVAQEKAMTDPFAWREIVNKIPGTPEPALRNSLLFLGHPELFQPTVNADHKRKIAAALCPIFLQRAASEDVDQDLFDLEARLTTDLGRLPDFYLDEDLRVLWQEPKSATGAEAVPAPAESAPAAEPSAPVRPEYSLTSIIEEGCFHPKAELELALKRWSDKKNLILEGAPGTGKTWVARRLAYALIGSKDPEAVRAVQFHPGTSYEDFVRGWRPGGDGTLRLVDGPLLQHAERARANPDVPHVLLIEEINRGNPAQAFGELLTLIEGTKRTPSDAIELAYHAEDEGPFHLPPNFHIIGTMNIADRSLALVDFALRRRFAFLRLEPQFNDAWEAALNKHFHQLSTNTLETIRARMSGLNDFIRTDSSLGGSFLVGHSFVTPTHGHSDPVAWFKDVARTDIGPLLDEYWFDAPDTAGEQRERLVEGL
ncbi:McrB family protein [Galactobacter valiniphilus]|nr:AAA family ATPase [Galactobacter valiniphilus]